MTNQLQVPQKSMWDYVHAAATAGVGLVAVAVTGSAIAKPIAETAFSTFIPSPYSRRAKEFDRAVADVFTRHEHRLHNVEATPERVDTLLDVHFAARFAATGTSAPEKFEALRNAVLNAAIGADIGSASADILTSLLQRLTPIHLRVLTILGDADAKFAEAGQAPRVRSQPQGLINLLLRAFPQWNAASEDIDVALRDLERDTLIRTDGSKMIYVDEVGKFRELITPFGRKLLKFISEPAAE